MENNILFSNNTTVEKVLYVAGMHNEHDESNKRIASSFLLAYAIIIVAILILLGGTDLKWWIVLLIGLGLTVITTILRVKLISMGENTRQDTHVTGEKFNWRYDFYEDHLTAEKDGEKHEIRYEDITKINDSGSSYQLRAADENYTIKKSGFSPADEQKMVNILRQYPAGLFLMNVTREEAPAENEESE